jgi:hypothetical protein
MEAEHPYLSLLVALDAALLLILAGLAKKQLEWKRPAPQPSSRRRERPARGSLGPLPRWMQVVLIIGICLGGIVASGAGLSGAAAPTAAAAYAAAAIFVLFATR